MFLKLLCALQKPGLTLETKLVSDATIPESRREIALSFRSKIEGLHQKSAAIDERIRTALSEKLDVTNSAAQLVYAAKKDLNESEFNLSTDFLDGAARASYLPLGR